MRIGRIGATNVGTPSLEVLPRQEGGTVGGVISHAGRNVRTESFRLTGRKVTELLQARNDSEVTGEDLASLLVRAKEAGYFTVAKGVVAAFDQGHRVTYIPGPESGRIREFAPEAA